MWKTLIDTLLIKVNIIDKSNNAEDNAALDTFGYVLITNHIKLWRKMFTKVNFIQMMLSSNPDIETANDTDQTDNDQRFIDSGLRILQKPEQVEKCEETATGNLLLKLMLRRGPIVWRVNFELTLCDAEDFFCFVTRPLLMVVKDQIQSENSLRRQLIKKDQEIQGFIEMLPKNSPLMRCLRTKKYNDEEHKTNHSAVVELLGTDPEKVICSQQILDYKRPVLKYDDEYVKDEPNSFQIRPGPSTAIKMESTTNGTKHSQANKFVPETPTRLSHIKIEPHDGKSEPNDSTTVNVLSEGQPPSANPPTDGLKTQNPTVISSILPISQEAQVSTSKKRRKKLNY